MRLLLRALGPRRLRPAVLAVTFAFLLAGGSLLAAVVDRGSGDRVLRSPFLAAAADADQDGMPDSFENRFGSNPYAASTLGGGVPDGWLFRWYGAGVDWNDTSLLAQPALEPPPEALPAALREGRLRLPTVQDLFTAENHTRKDPFWWEQRAALDPTKWDNDGDGLADAWALQHGLDPAALQPDAPAPGDASMTLRAKYEHGLDPTATDSDADGLTDREELDGRTQAGDPFRTTDPALPSTAGTGVPDGYLVRLALDPLDPASADAAPGRDGLSVRRAWNVTAAFCRAEPGCVLHERIRSGLVVDPRVADSNGDGIPDAWALQAGEPAHPLRDGRQVHVADASAWDAAPWGGDPASLAGLLVDPLNPKPADPSVSLLHLYAYGRPPGWDEARNGTWWGGLLPGQEPAPGALPLAVALRGWRIASFPCRGCSPADPGPETVAQAFADPRKADSDGDGLSDAKEYYGLAGGPERARTDPRDRDTDRDGLEDGAEAGLHTHPLRRDTAGSFLADGESFAYWTARYAQAKEDVERDPALALESYGWLLQPGEDASVLTPDGALRRLLPTESLRGGASNLLSNDTDGDGLRTGAELFPNRFLDQPSSHARPITFPERADSDGDGLPDAWEVRWSQDRYYDCAAPCTNPPGSEEADGWPLDPSRFNSFRAGAAPPGDRDLDLTGDRLLAVPGKEVAFSSGLAYRFGLNPYQRDNDHDGLSNLFELWWGSLGVPDARRAELEDRAADDPANFRWLHEQASRLARAMPPGEGPVPRVAVLDPASADERVRAGDSLTALFEGREKGTWIASPEPCAVGRLPSADLASSFYSPDPLLRLRSEDANGDIPSRAGLAAPCWRWEAYPLSSDAGNRTDPWRHDFDGDGLPDAWERRYAKEGAERLAATPGSLLGGCQDPALTSGLPKGDHCLSYLRSYALGLDPTRADSDGGGMADWFEVALRSGLDPLDARDDHGEEDWDGDGLPNRVEVRLGTSPVNPDSDGDGLLDGDPVGVEPLPFLAFNQGNGGLCLRPAGSSTDWLPGLAHRPASPPWFPGDQGGNLTRTHVLDRFVALGLVHDDPGTRCPQDERPAPGAPPYPYVRFEREAARDAWSTPPVNLGTRTSSTQWASRPDGVPDGWLAYWMVQTASDTVRQALDPDPRSARVPDPDRDGLPTAAEYARARPVDWDEARDGVWWGGSDPTRDDTDGDSPWLERKVEGQDLFDADLDGDGIPEQLDAWPGLDAANSGLAFWDAPVPGDPGRYRTRSPEVWAALEARRTAFLRDADADDVPDFLDRARVQVDAQFPSLSLAKGKQQWFTVAGSVTLRETGQAGVAYEGVAQGVSCPPSPASCAVPVGGATVKVVLDDGVHEAVLGAALTDANGNFAIPANLETLSLEPAARMTVAGHRLEAGVPMGLANGLENVLPGPVRLRVVAEPNDPSWQPLSFNGQPPSSPSQPAAVAYKDTQGPVASRFRIPTGDPAIDGATSGDAAQRGRLAGARLDAGRQGPDLSEGGGHVQHSARAIFAAASQPSTLELRSTTALELTPPAGRVRAGEALAVSVTLRDAQQAGLPGHTLTIDLLEAGGALLRTASGTSGPDGSFAASLPTTGLPPGGYKLRASAVLAGGQFLDDPLPAGRDLVLAQDTAWQASDGFRANGLPLSAGQLVLVAADAPLEVQARLLDKLDGRPVAGRAATAVLEAGGPPVLLAATTGPDGWAAFHLPRLPPGLVADDVRLVFKAAKATSQDANEDAELFLRPRFPTRLVGHSGAGPIGTPVWLRAALEYHDGAAWRPAKGATGAFDVQGGGVRFQAPPDGDGALAWNTTSGDPGRSGWTARFLAPPDGDGFFLSSPEADLAANFTSATVLRIVGGSLLRGQPAAVTGTLALADGRPAAGAVQVRWGGGEWVAAQAGADGTWSATLAVPDLPGKRPAEARFAGTPFLLPSVAEAGLDVRRATALVLSARSLSVAPDGTSTGALAGRLVDDEGIGLAGERLALRLADPRATVRLLEVVTGPGGAFEAGWASLAPGLPGKWAAEVRYDGGARNAPATQAADLWVEHRNRLEVQRFPAALLAGASASLEGRILGPTPVGLEGGPQLEAAIAQGPTAQLQHAPRAWRLELQLADLQPGPYRILVQARGIPNATYDPAEVRLQVLVPVSAQVRESGAGGGARNITILVEKEGAFLAETGLVLLRRDEAGNIIGVHDVRTDARGRARLQLSAEQEGHLTLAYVADPGVQLAQTVYSSTLVPAPPPGVSANRWLPLVAGGAVLLAGAGLAVAYAAWRRRSLAALASALDEAAAGLLDPNAPARQVIRAAYARLLALMAKAGFRPTAADTVQDIAQAATAALRLPQTPMQAVSRLFERAIYSTEPMGDGERAEALSTFQVLRAALGGRAARPEASG